MSTGFYAAASGMLMQQRSLNAISNNMGNTKTPGFKTERVVSNVFEFELLNRIENGNNLIGKGAPVRIVQDVPTGFDDPSSLEETGRPFDMALNGLGFFNVKVPGVGENAEDQVYMTRNGNFDLDSEGYLILRGAGRVQGKNGDILLGSSNFTVLGDGTILNSTGRMVDQLYITAAKDNTQLTKAGNGLFKVEPNPPATPATIDGRFTYDTGEDAGVVELTGAQIDVRQGWLEASNVNLNREMTLMIETQRNFQSCSQALKVIDQRNQKTATICAKV